MRRMHDRQMTLEIQVPGFTGSAGARLQVADIGPPYAPALLLLHGYADSAYSFSRVAPLLAREMRLIAPDQRGHGDSERPASGYSPAGLASDAFGILDALGIEAATVAGHSMGSFVAQHMALQQPERVEALVLIGSAMDSSNATTASLLTEVEALGDVVEPEFIRAFQQSTLCCPVPAEFFETVLAESAKLPAHLWKLVLRELLNSGPVIGLDAIRCPVWVVGGAEDAVFSAEEQQALAARIPGSELSILAGIGHDPQWEDPDGFAEQLLRFCQRVPTPMPR